MKQCSPYLFTFEKYFYDVNGYAFERSREFSLKTPGTYRQAKIS